jgi:esterase/lipase superfamily enzyme
MFVLFGLLAALALPAHAAEPDPFAELAPMLSPVPAMPDSWKGQEAAWTELRDKLVAAREVNHPAVARCYWDGLQSAPLPTVETRLAEIDGCADKARPKVKVRGSKISQGVIADGHLAEEVPGTLVEVFYGTDRVKSGEGYGGAPRCPRGAPAPPEGCVDVGIAKVNIPDTHKFGEVESEMPSLWTLKPNPQTHLFLVGLDHLDGSAWATRLKGDLSKAGHGDVFVYIHGFNNSFESAALRAAQMAFDLKFPGAPVMWSWASSGSLTGYYADEESVEATVPHLRAFLQRLGQEGGAKRLHIVAHSMGTRTIGGLVKSIQTQGAIPGVEIASLILAAPDIDAEVFKTDIAPRLGTLSKRSALYVNAGDKALLASKIVHPDHHDRAGAVPIYVDGLTTIDATTVGTDMLGHAYFGSAPRLILDILAHWAGKTTVERPWLGAVEKTWVFKAP